MNDLICVTAVEGEPRVLDTELAAALGMARPTNIRGVIEQNKAELEGFGPCTARVHDHPTVFGRTTTAFYLNEEQALLVAMFSRTEKAKEVRATLVRVFAAYRRGDLVPAASAALEFRISQTFAEALRLAADSAALGALA